MARLLRKRDGVVLADFVTVANRFWSRCVGLLGRRSLEPRHGLLITPCAGVHTFGMRFPLDLVFLSRSWEVVRVVRNLPPNRMARGGRGAYCVLEMGAGNLPADTPAPGDIVTLSNS